PPGEPEENDKKSGTGPKKSPEGPVPITKDALLLQIDKVSEDAGDAITPNDAIRVLETGLKRLDPLCFSRPEPEILSEMADLYFELMELYGGRGRYEKALVANARELDYLKRLHRVAPAWKPKKKARGDENIRSPSIAVRIYENRADFT